VDQDYGKVNPYEEKEVFDCADQFVNLANELSQSDTSGNVGVGLRYAAARYCAFEASLHTNNFDEDMEKHLESYASDFKNMLRINFEDYSKKLADQKKSTGD